MGLINKDTMQQILSHYHDDLKDLVKYQIETMEIMITDNREKYVSDAGYQEAFDFILKNIIEGKFLKE